MGCLDPAAPVPDGGYRGPAILTVNGERFSVRVELRGHFQPIDGRYHWYGRIARNDLPLGALRAAHARGLLTTGEGSAPCELSDPDPWHRYRVSGVSTPPYCAT